MRTRLKICGITRLEDARYAAAKGADYLGFIQFEESPRYIAPQTAADIIEWVYGPTPVGVFVDATAETVNRVAEEAGFQLVQLHGDEPAFEVASIDLPVIKALRIGPTTSTEELRTTIGQYEDVADYFLLDTLSETLRGGTGTTFNWDVVGEIGTDYKFFLAGGINESNVADAVGTMEPFAIDVSSSLESSPGMKVFGKIDAFVDAFDEACASRRLED